MFRVQPWDQRDFFLRGRDPEACPLGTDETQIVARTGKSASSTFKILAKIGDCERSNVMLHFKAFFYETF